MQRRGPISGEVRSEIWRKKRLLPGRVTGGTRNMVITLGATIATNEQKKPYGEKLRKRFVKISRRIALVALVGAKVVQAIQVAPADCPVREQPRAGRTIWQDKCCKYKQGK